MNAEELIAILRQGEGTRVEFKSEFPAQGHAIGKEMAALANSGGGILLMGVADDGAPKGIEDADRVVERLAGIARSCGLSVSPEIDKFQVARNVFVVYAKIRACPPCFYERKIYHRVGSTSVECTSGDQLQHILSSGSQPGSHSGQPPVVGTPPRAGEPTRSRTPKRNEASFFEALEQESSADEVEVARRILEWSKDKFSEINWGGASFSPVLDYGHKYSHNPITVYSSGKPGLNAKIGIKFLRMRNRNPPFDLDEKRLDLLRRLNEIPGIKLPDNSIGRVPTITLGALADERALSQFQHAIEWTIEEVKAAEERRPEKGGLK